MTVMEMIIDQYKIILDRRLVEIKRRHKNNALRRDWQEINMLRSAIGIGTLMPGFRTDCAAVLEEEVTESINSMYKVHKTDVPEATYFRVGSGEYAYYYGTNTLSAAAFPHKEHNNEFLNKGMVHINYGDINFLRHSAYGLTRRVSDYGGIVETRDFSGLTEKYIPMLRKAVRRAKERRARLLILDGVLDACGSRQLPKETVVNFLLHKPYELEVVMSGTDVPRYLVPYADYLSSAKALRVTALVEPEKQHTQASVHAFYGDVTLRETAVLGMCERAAQAGKRTALVRFLYAQTSRFPIDSPGFRVINAIDSSKFTYQMTKDELDETSRRIRAAFLEAEKLALSQCLDLLALDGIFDVFALGFIPIKYLLRFLHKIPAALELVVSGENMPTELNLIAKTIGFTENLRHPYQRGIPAREGIDY